MLLEDAGRILHRHLIASERHHLAPQYQMQGVERRTAQNFRGNGHLRSRCKSPRPLERGPSVIGPERFPRHVFEKTTPDYPFGGSSPLSIRRGAASLSRSSSPERGPF